MSYLAERQALKEKQRAEALEKNTRQRDEHLATMSNPDSNVDELGNAIRWFFLPLCTLWVGYIGYIFTQKELEGVVEPWQAMLLSIALPAFVQIVKVYAATKALRAFHFKWYDRSAHDLWFWIGVGALVLVMFFWSLKISIWDIKDTSKEKFIAQNSDSLSVVLASATGSLDAQIASLNAENAAAASMKTKRGTLAWSGQKIKMENATTLSSLNEQKAKITDQTLADYGSKKLKVEKAAAHRGNFFQRFGGFGEVLEIIMLLLLGLVEAINRNNNAERLGISGKPQPLASTQADPLSEFSKNGHSHINNEASTTPIQFRWNGYGQTSVQPVTHPHIPVSQSAQQNPVVIGSNQILQRLRTKLQADIPNLIKKNGVPATISNRITKAFEECYEAMGNTDFRPSRQVAAMVYGYLAETAIPTLNGVGYPYEHDSRFMQRLMKVIPPEHAEA